MSPNLPVAHLQPACLILTKMLFFYDVLQFFITSIYLIERGRGQRAREGWER